MRSRSSHVRRACSQARTTLADGSNDVKNDDGPGGAAHVSRVAIACGRARGRADRVTAAVGRYEARGAAEG